MAIDVVVFDGFDELDAFAPFEVLAHAGLDVRLVGGRGAGQIVSSHGLHLQVPAMSERPEGVVVAGGGWLTRAEAGAWAEAELGVLPATLAQVAPTARWMASVCSGAMLLARAGLLEGRSATTNRRVVDDLRPYVREVLDEPVVEDGDRITSGGPSTGLYLGLRLVERELGPDGAARAAAAVELDRAADGWRPKVRTA